MTTQKIGKIILDDSNLSSDQTVNMPTNGGTLQNSTDVSSSISTHNASSGRHGVTGNIVGTTDTQALTNKDVDGGTASNNNRITLPSNTTTNITSLNRKVGTIIYDSTKTVPIIDDGTNIHDLITNDDTQTLENKSIKNGSSYGVTPKTTNLTSNINMEYQNRTGVYADIQNVADSSTDKSSYYFDGNADYITTITTAALTTNDLDLTVLVVASNNNLNSANTNVLFRLQGTSKEFTIYKQSSTNLIVLNNNASQSSTSDTVFPVDNSVNSLLVIKKHNAGKFQIALNGILYSEKTLTSPDSLNTTCYMRLSHSSTAGWAGKIFRAILFNYAITDINKIKKYSLGGKIDLEDIGGSMTEISSGTPTIGKRYRITAYTDFDFTSWGSANNTVGTEFLCTLTGSGTLDAGDKVIQLGAIIDLEPEGIYKQTIDGAITNKWIDSSGNGLHGTATSAVPLTNNEYIDDVVTGVSLTNGEYNDGGTITLPAGEWDIEAVAKFTPDATTSVTVMSVFIGTASGNSSTGLDQNRNFNKLCMGATVLNEVTVLHTPKFRVVTDGTVTYRCKLFSNFTVSTMAAEGTLIARRIS